MASPRVKDIDKGAKALLARVADAKNRAITVGIHEAEAGSAHEGGATVGDIATIHEYGLGNVPPRSWLGAWADAKKPGAEQDMRKLGQALVKGTVKSVDQGLEQLAQAYAGQCQANFPNISPPTGSGRTPLVDTGQLRGSIRGEVSK